MARTRTIYVKVHERTHGRTTSCIHSAVKIGGIIILSKFSTQPITTIAQLHRRTDGRTDGQHYVHNAAAEISGIIIIIIVVIKDSAILSNCRQAVTSRTHVPLSHASCHLVSAFYAAASTDVQQNPFITYRLVQPTNKPHHITSFFGGCNYTVNHKKTCH